MVSKNRTEKDHSKDVIRKQKEEEAEFPISPQSWKHKVSSGIEGIGELKQAIEKQLDCQIPTLMLHQWLFKCGPGTLGKPQGPFGGGP